jgi:tRNA modification GTPase
MLATDDTIVAIATPPGRGALGVVRLSGPRALNLAGEFLDRGDALQPRHATFTRVQCVDNASALDEVVATFFPAPQSNTG